MSEQKHTPGEWISYGGGKRRWAVGRAGGGCSVCQLTRNDEEAANARLIAAAPNLLAACQLALPHMEASAGAEHMMDGLKGRKHRAIDNQLAFVQAAIAKALGASPCRTDAKPRSNS